MGIIVSLVAALFTALFGIFVVLDNKTIYKGLRFSPRNHQGRRNLVHAAGSDGQESAKALAKDFP
jgi:hypothetical protein